VYSIEKKEKSPRTEVENSFSVSIKKKKNPPEQKLKKEANFCSG